MKTSSQEECSAFMRRLRNVLKTCPKDCWIFVTGEEVALMRYGPDGGRQLVGGRDGAAMDPEAVVETIGLHGLPMPEMDGGAW